MTAPPPRSTGRPHCWCCRWCPESDSPRPKWSDAAADVTAAVAAGITSSTTAEDVLGRGSDEAIAAWRTIGPAVAVLDRIQTLTSRLLFLCGYYLGEDETNRHGRAAWLDASESGPVPLRSRGERSAVDTRTGLKVGENRSPVAIGIHAEIVETAERAEEVTTEQRTAFARAEHQAQRRQAEAEATMTTIDQPKSDPLGGF